MKHEVVVDFVVELYTLYNFYLDAEGRYQVRVSMQGDSRYYSQVLLGPTKRLNGTYVTKTFSITRTCDSIQTDLDEAVRFEVHLFLRNDVRLRLMDATYELRLEVWCSKMEDEDGRSTGAKRPSPFTAVTARVMTLTFDPVRGLHHYYPVVFEVSNLSVLTMTVHASLTTICIPSDRSMRNASVSHLVGQLCSCDGQSSCCYSASIDKSVQQELNSLLTHTASHLRKILEEHQRQSAVDRKSREADIGKDAGSERARTRVSRYSTLDRPEAVRFQDEESKKLSVILVVLWEQYLEAVVGHQELRFVLYEPLQRARTARLCEGYLILNKNAEAVYYDGVVDENMYRQMARKIRGSDYFKSLPVLEIECWPLDGNNKNTPVIFEERYRSLTSPSTADEDGTGGLQDDVAELASVHTLTAGSMELLALSTHPESEVCNCHRQLRATYFRFRRPSATSLSPALSELYHNANSGCYRIYDTQRFSQLRRGLWDSLKIPVSWRTPDVAELLALNFPQAKTAMSDSVHLIVLVHGMYGCSTDLRLLRVFLELALPCSNVRFLMSRANEVRKVT
ncbi:protein FAM135B-like [Amblyomma americanum]